MECLTCLLQLYCYFVFSYFQTNLVSPHCLSRPSNMGRFDEWWKSPLQESCPYYSTSSIEETASDKLVQHVKLLVSHQQYICISWHLAVEACIGCHPKVDLFSQESRLGTTCNIFYLQASSASAIAGYHLPFSAFQRLSPDSFYMLFKKYKKSRLSKMDNHKFMIFR